MTLEQIRDQLNQLLDRMDSLKTMAEIEKDGSAAIMRHARSILELYQKATSGSDQVSAFRLLAMDSVF